MASREVGYSCARNEVKSGTGHTGAPPKLLKAQETWCGWFRETNIGRAGQLIDSWGISRQRVFVFLILCLVGQVFYLILPRPLFDEPNSTVLLDRGGNLLGARISADQQWRFPTIDKVPDKFRKAILNYEDRYFYYHPGINPAALVRAAYLNIRQGRVVSGGSTLTMQVIRLARKNPGRTYLQKAVETFLAFRLEFSFSKDEILRLYASHAPFGGNVVGLDAASWRYFGVDPQNLSWGEAATLAVLPNSPGLIYPGRNPRQLLAKRNALLDQLLRRGVIDEATCRLAKSETLPLKPFSIPQWAPHLLERAIKDGFRGQKTVTTLDRDLQERVAGILTIHENRLKANYIRNAAALVLDVNSGNVLAYCGNMPGGGSENGSQVDIITAPRSTGSILKPFLYAAMLHDGLLLPNTLVPDIPTQISGFIPENYNLTYDGAVPAKNALSRSLNIPAVKMLQTYGYEQFYALLRKMGMTTLVKPARHYGLALILGGAEATLWDLAGIYASMARTLNSLSPSGPGGPDNDGWPEEAGTPQSTRQKKNAGNSGFHPPCYVTGKPAGPQIRQQGTASPDPASIWLTFEAMIEVSRPDEEIHWRHFASGRKIAWKTGTSFGNRDAWSIGVTPDHVVAVWVGNASGEGRPGLTGITAAAPVLFDIFQLLPASAWFTQPDCTMIRIPVCRYSGHRPSAVCDVIDTMWVQKAGARTSPCPYHQIIHLDNTGTWQVNSDCEAAENMQHVPWFILPPVQEWYFRNKNPFYKILPPFRKDCTAADTRRNMEIIYPKNNSRIYIPIELDGTPGSAVFKVAHRDGTARIYWHLDDRFMGITTAVHQLALKPGKGMHHLTLVDQGGESLRISFEVISDRGGS